MSRPEYPNCIMTPGVIRGVREEQAYYDADPEAYERAERLREEEYQRELEELQFLQQQERNQYE